MADKSLELATTAVMFLSIIGGALWAGSVIQAKGAEKLEQACYPIDFATDQVQRLTTALVGFTPRWTVSVKQYLEGGCYYFFSIILRPDIEGEGLPGTEPQGGVRTS